MGDSIHEQTDQNIPENVYLRNWLEKNEYFIKRDEFVKRQKARVEKQLLEVGCDQNLVGDMAVVVSRGAYLFNLMCSVLKVEEKVSTKLVWPSNMPMERTTRGQASFFIDVNGEPSESIELELNSAKEGKSVTLNRAEVVVNLREIKKVAAQMIRYEESGDDLAKRGEIEEGSGKKMRQEGLEELAIKTEECVVEEVAHVLYVHSMFKDKSRLIKWLESMLNYSPHLPGDEESLIKIDTEEERKMRKEKYTDTDIEKKARVLKKLFLKKYYPNFEDRE